jgi:hypothetical protein
MDPNTLPLILAGLSVAGTLAGVLVGNALEVRGEERRRLRETYEESLANAGEVVVQLQLVEAQLRGGPPAPPPRPELARDVFRPMSRAALGSRAPIPELDLLREAIVAAVNPATFGVTADQRAAQQAHLLNAMTALQDTARQDLHAHWWNRLWRRVRPS